MKITTLLENGACGAELGSAHGLSLYIETPKHKILFDMGQTDAFAAKYCAVTEKKSPTAPKPTSKRHIKSRQTVFFIISVPPNRITKSILTPSL